ncbi:MAG: DUF58 domain-containing protein [Candidatus Cloacimonetes bacterium]|nr:DUF58 domain-containing protein [Candidatus Cloacimonadota bacterium]
MLTQTPKDILRRIRKIEIHTRTKVSEVFRGEYHSSFRGQGLEFAEVREYQPGDSYRSIDWNVSARLGYPYVKLYQETRELNVVFIVDVSASQDFGTRMMLKKEKVAELVAVLAFSALSNNDKVGMIMYSNILEKYLPANKGRNRALQMLRDILYLQPKEKGTDLGAAFSYANLILKKRSVIFVLSDFLSQDFIQPLKMLARRHDVIALQVLDEAELELPRAGIINFQDPETGHTIHVNTSNPLLRKRYATHTRAAQEELKTELAKASVEHLLFTPKDEITGILRGFFERRKRRRYPS